MIDHETQVAEIAAFARCGLDEAETAARQFGAEKCLCFAKLEGRLPLDGLDMLAVFAASIVDTIEKVHRAILAAVVEDEQLF